jgi:hypothetical protein
MRSLRLWFAATVLWLLVLFNIERFHEPINIASFVYVLTGLSFAAVMVVPAIRKLGFGPLSVFVALMLIVFKYYFGYPIVGNALPLTVTELAAVTLTLWLAHGASQAMMQFDRSLTTLASTQTLHRVLSALPPKDKFYREVQRARQFGRNLGVIALQPAGQLDAQQMDQLLNEVRHNLAHQHAQARLGELLLNAVRDTDLIAMDDDRLYVVMPEANQDQLADWVRDLRQRVMAQLGLELAAGSAVFPDEEVTLAGLLDRSIATMATAPLHGHATDQKSQDETDHGSSMLPWTESAGSEGMDGLVGAVAKESA